MKTRINWERIRDLLEPVQQELEISSREVSLGKDMIIACAERWLDQDMARYEKIEIEKSVDNARLDMVGILKNEDREIVDWKTTSSDLTFFEERCRLSWQWRIYASLEENVKVFRYRGISSQMKGIPGAMRFDVQEVLLPVAQWDIDAARNVRDSVSVAVNHYLSHASGAWPRAMSPDACYRWRLQCPYLKDCLTTPPERKPAERVEKISYSSMRLFFICPERLRRHMLDEEDGVKRKEPGAAIGSYVHKGLEFVWRQAYESRNT